MPMIGVVVRNLGKLNSNEISSLVNEHNVKDYGTGQPEPESAKVGQLYISDGMLFLTEKVDVR